MSSFRITSMAVPALLIVLLFSTARAAEIHTAARAGDVEKVRALLAQGEDIDRPSLTGTALHVAILADKKDVAELLIAEGANVNATVFVFGTPLHVAALRGWADLATRLIANGADVNAGDNQGLTPLHHAAERGYLDLVEMLIGSGANVNAASENSDTPLHRAAVTEEREVMALLAAKGAAAPVVEPVSGLLSAASVRDGESVAGRCLGCHNLQKDQGRKVQGPSLWGMVGRRMAGADDFEYSPAFKRLSGNWTYEALNAFIANPKAFVPGTKMNYKGFANVSERANLIAFLRQLSDKPVPLPEQ